jgi:hypothetical protein
MHQVHNNTMSQEVTGVEQHIEPRNEWQHKSCHKLPPCNTHELYQATFKQR